MDGEFLAFQKLDNELSACPMDKREVRDMTLFGVVTENKCEFELFDLIDNNSDNLPLIANSFFELYLEDANKNLIDVPVLIKNFRDIDGDSPNESFNYASSRMTHRFFIYDTISGIQNRQGYINSDGKQKAQNPDVIRYASRVRLSVQLDPDQEERIRKPLLEITYTEHLTSVITKTSEVPAAFYFEYYEEVNDFENAAEIIVYVSNALVLIIVLMRMYYWYKLNPPQFLARKFGPSFAWKLFVYLTDTWSNIMFMVYFLISGYWFFFYKMQANASVLMPQRDVPNSTYDVFFIFLVTIISAKTVAILLVIFEQSSADIFIMDWERYEHSKPIEV